MNVDDAIKAGAVALFDEKYGETVRVFRWEITVKNSVAEHIVRQQAR